MPETLDGGVDESGELRTVGEVPLVGRCLNAQRLEFCDSLGGFVGAVGAVVVHDDVGAVGSQ